MLDKSKKSSPKAPKKFDIREYFFTPECPSCGLIDHEYMAYCEVCGYRKWFKEE